MLCERQCPSASDNSSQQLCRHGYLFGSSEKRRSPVQHKAILNTWKEIAQYVGRSVRTIQRWESELGFPIHRPRGKQRSAVIAMPPEIDEWARRTPSAGVPAHASNVTVLDRTKWQQRHTDKQAATPASDQNNGQKRPPRLRAGR